MKRRVAGRATLTVSKPVYRGKPQRCTDYVECDLLDKWPGTTGNGSRLGSKPRLRVDYLVQVP